ncbi:hypothetical protein C8Q77DRAFT_1161282 [Trametes polyzona]|nr:hypothetical protein C8Q77DRAFT_1161282 [Trametes polyzona]
MAPTESRGGSPPAVPSFFPETGAVKKIGTLHQMDIIGPPTAYITRQFEGITLICGFGLCFPPGGSVREHRRRRIRLARTTRKVGSPDRQRPPQRAAHTYRGDVKPDNAILDENDNAASIDFEQGRANKEAAAPELHAEVSPPSEATGDSATVLKRREKMTCTLSVIVHIRTMRGRRRSKLRRSTHSDTRSQICSQTADASTFQPLCSSARPNPNVRLRLDGIEKFFRDWHSSLLYKE